MLHSTKVIMSLIALCFFLGGCSVFQKDTDHHYDNNYGEDLGYAGDEDEEFVSRMPTSREALGEKVVVFDPAIHEWGAYDEDGDLVRSGPASGGSDYCADIKKPCRTKVGEFRVFRKGDADCYSRSFPLVNKDGGKGGAPMPHCMFFTGGIAMHGSHHVPRANVSHGCMRARFEDAEWLHSDFVKIGTKVIVKPYPSKYAENDIDDDDEI